MNTQGHGAIRTFDVFSQKMIDRFDRKDEDDYIKDLTTVTQKRSMEDYVVEFQCIAITVTSVSEKRVTFLSVKDLYSCLGVW